ncbi:deoxyhypusine synthase family protein [Acidobacteria bacterium AH-259-A15]|nr:deoxyhypusine synthase family protein [Acidobacteria bacterium AH-259-A15]
MSKYKEFKVERVRDYPLESRPSKVNVTDFARPLEEDSVSALVASLPNLLAAGSLCTLIEKIQKAREKSRAIIWGFGGHVVKVGLTPVLIDLMERGFVTALATNGSGMIHDFEIALSGRTSEDVEQQLQSGAFGMARETGEFLNEAISKGASQSKGIGESVAEFLAQNDTNYPSLLLEAHNKDVPCTVHIAIGTDIIHNHPQASGEAMGKGSQIDFRIFIQQVSLLHDGGVYLNLGSAVILPEVFLKAVSLVRNAGYPLENFTTANLDFIQHYRPTKNVVERPVLGSGTGIALTGHHEIMIPLMAAMLIYG